MKTCTVCEKTKSLSEFYNSSTKKGGKSYRCKVCDAHARKNWQKRNPEKVQLSQRGRNLKHKYGISLNDYECLLKEQQYSCAICGVGENSSSLKGPNKDLSFSVDHDHGTGRVRGLLCNQCNGALGLFQDKVHLLRNALKYLTHTLPEGDI